VLQLQANWLALLKQRKLLLESFVLAGEIPFTASACEAY